MGNMEFPEKVTAESIPRLIETGYRIENLKPWWARRHPALKTRIAVGFTWLVILILAGLGMTLLLIGWLYGLIYLGWLPILNVYGVLAFSIALAVLVFLVFVLLVRDRILPRFYPPPNQMVFCDLVEIARCMLNKKRKDAVKGLYHLGVSLRKYFRKNNELKFALENEMQLFYSIALDRLVLFSKDKKIPNLFLSLGLAFAKEDEPIIYSTAVDICKKIKRFNGDIGKSRGLWFFLEAHAKSINVLVYVVLVVVNVVLAILYVSRLIPILPASPLT